MGYNMSMTVQYITDNKGRKTSVVVPYKEWEKLQKEMQKQRVLLGIKSSVSEARDMKSGRMRMPSIDKLLDEL
jgi:hypothetical protein